MNGPGDKEAVIWGTGTPRREFLYSDDLADACVFLMEKCDAKEVGEFVYDKTKPDGTPQKLLDVSRLTGLGWRARTGLREGLTSAYRDFLGAAPSSDRGEVEGSPRGAEAAGHSVSGSIVVAGYSLAFVS